MRRSRIFLSFLPLTLACSALGEPRRSIVLGVHDVVAPAEVAVGSELVATITVVTGGCKSFDRFVTARAANRLTVEARGWDAAGAGRSCPADIRYEAREYRATLPAGDPVVLAVRQPNGTEVVREIDVR